MRGDCDHVVAQLGSNARTDWAHVEGLFPQQRKECLSARDIVRRSADDDAERLAFCPVWSATDWCIEETDAFTFKDCSDLCRRLRLRRR